MTSPWQFDQNPAAAAAGDPDGPVGGPPQQPGPAPAGGPAAWWKAGKGDILAGLVVLAVCLVAAVAAGAVWHALAPDMPRVVVNHNVYDTPQTPVEGEVARDGWFAVVGVVTGLLIAAAVFWKGRRHGIGVAVALGLGGLLGSYVAYKVGAALGPDTFGDQLKSLDGRHDFDEPLRIQAMGVLYLWPMASLVLYIFLYAAFGPRDAAQKQLGGWPPRGYAQQPGTPQPGPWQFPGAGQPGPQQNGGLPGGTRPGAGPGHGEDAPPAAGDGPDLTKRAE
ncbi:hypothetical protein [Yinghuangia seranimata]|uniref:hypothetical protein n=1 Tax=Yinghuangia seranimata TaxID=408067 RepID=UPI00248BD0E2|nr:hypothetical protein [Yinghuangia seranimata]MDI2126212.1 hypothetical protein [Yinghuangia seranimata]